MPRLPSVSAWVGAVVLAAVSALGLGVPQAQAHAELIDSSPAEGDTVTAPLSEITLTFNEPVKSDFAQITVLDQDDNKYEAGDLSIVGDTATQTVDDLPDGKYTLSYRIVSADGHPVTGSITFTVTGGGAADSDEPEDDGTEQPNQPAANDDASSSGGGTVSAGWVAAGVLVVAAVVVGAVVMLRPRTKPQPRPDGHHRHSGRDTEQ